MISAHFAQATPKHPTRLTHGALLTLTHELGHAIHTLVRGSLKNVPRDFIEIPSVMLENWVYIPEVVREISCHYTYLDPAYLKAWQTANPFKVQPQQKPPADMTEDLKYNRHPKYNMADLQNILWASVFDLVIHSAWDKNRPMMIPNDQHRQTLDKWTSAVGFDMHSFWDQDLSKMDLGHQCRQVLDKWTGIFTVPSTGDRNNAYLHWDIIHGYETSTYCYLL